MRRGLLTWAGQNVDGVSDTDGFAGGSNHCSEDIELENCSKTDAPGFVV